MMPQTMQREQQAEKNSTKTDVLENTLKTQRIIRYFRIKQLKLFVKHVNLRLLLS